MGIRSTNPTQSFGDEQNVRSVGNPFSAFNDTFGGTGRDAATRPHPGGPAIANGGERFKVPLDAAPAPSGGGYVYHFFTNTSTPATFEVEYGPHINVLVVGGGGRGVMGGGGGGGVAQAINLPTGLPGAGIRDNNIAFTATVIVGQGHNPANSGSTPPTTGGNSTITYAPLHDPTTPITITGLGGGNGGSSVGRSGGSGGSTGRFSPTSPTDGVFPGGTGLQPSENSGLSFTVNNYGYPGQDVPKAAGSSYVSRGGGGSGETAPAFNSAFGGDGQPFSFLPGPVIYPYMPASLQSTLGGTAWRDAVTSGGNLGGGGGGHRHSTGVARPSGGAGGGGKGGIAAPPSSESPGLPGINYTGGGGGGSNNSIGVSPGPGGHGIVIFYYYVGEDDLNDNI